MTFKELALLEETQKPRRIFQREDESPFWQNFLENQSPVMKVWFCLMLINLLFISWLIG